jgi:bidirectional [NiFe] hydrogenase diaphorase subunit
MLQITVDGRDIEVEEKTTLLAACLENDIYIPNLCFLENMTSPYASCRLCFVEIAGVDRPVASCTIRATQGMRIFTDTAEVRRLQRSALRMLLSVHHIDCRNCPANKQCELQRIAKYLKMGLKARPLDVFLKDTSIDTSHSCIDIYPNRCVLCGKCIEVCRVQNGQPLFTFAKRGFHTVISAYGFEDESADSCHHCEACIKICPVAALVMRAG